MSRTRCYDTSIVSFTQRGVPTGTVHTAIVFDGSTLHSKNVLIDYRIIDDQLHTARQNPKPMSIHNHVHSELHASNSGTGSLAVSVVE
jgi:hypothetical protein